MRYSRLRRVILMNTTTIHTAVTHMVDMAVVITAVMGGGTAEGDMDMEAMAGTVTANLNSDMFHHLTSLPLVVIIKDLTSSLGLSW